MSSSNTYAKQYSNRRTTNETEQYKLLLFPKDNSIAVVKSKQCSPAEHDGCFHVQSGGKKFMGVVLAEGDLEQCSKAADQLSKKQINSEIESDYERPADEENRPKRITASSSNISTLNKIPFGNQTFNTDSSTAGSTQTQQHDHSGSSNSDRSSCTRKNDTTDITTSDSLPSANTSTLLPLSDSINDDQSNRHHGKKTNLSVTKRRKISSKEKRTAVTFDDSFSDGDLDEAAADVESREQVQSMANKNRSSSNETPQFSGRRVTPKTTNETATEPNISSILQRILGTTNKLESQYLRSLLVGQERLETMTKCIFANQKKIQKTLRKHKVNILLTELNESNDNVDEQNFLSSSEFTSSEGLQVDLLKRSGVKEHANRYVTSLIDILYKPEELLALKTNDVTKDERYLLLKEAVRNKFRLNQEELETIWVWLHTVFLAKWRTLNAKTKKLSTDLPNS